MAGLGTPLPDWAEQIVQPGHRFEDAPAVLDAAIDLATGSARNGSGPFGALIVDDTLEVVSTGWNRVIENVDSTSHAEIEAIRAAELRLGTHDLGATDRGPLAIFTSCAPCVMCFGAIYWSGLARVVAAASADAAERIGFQEGPVTDEMWTIARKHKGIAFESEASTRRDPAEPFHAYEAEGGALY